MEYMVLDVFSDQALMGNPVAVVFCDQHQNKPGTAGMQKLAAWFNLSETVFVMGVLPASQDDKEPATYVARIFTPGGELPFAGHPTIGTAAAVREKRLGGAAAVIQQCGAGNVSIRFDDASKSVHLVSPEVTVAPVSPEAEDSLRSALGLKEPAISTFLVDAGPLWITVLSHPAEDVSGITPDQQEIQRISRMLDATGVVVGGLNGDSHEIEVRTFAPAVGVPEDPVCGSGNIALAALRRNFGFEEAGYQARQGRAVGRDGYIEIGFLPDGSIELGGRVAITAVGKLAVETVSSPNYSLDCHGLTSASVIGRVDGKNVVGTVSRR